MPDSSAEIRASVVYREGPLAPEDYQEAIDFLVEARQQVLVGNGYFCPCGDDCAPGRCHHDPLVMARRGAAAQTTWRCFHCGTWFTDEKAAEEHVGKSELEVARCLQEKADGRLLRELDEAEQKAIDSLGRYKFQMFGYWSAIWVHLNRICGVSRPNPFKQLVLKAREARK